MNLPTAITLALTAWTALAIPVALIIGRAIHHADTCCWTCDQ